jgi:DNA-binding transcriptional regulator YiaG
MPNIGTVLREEVSRLSRKEARSQVDPTRKATAQHRRQIAELKRQVAQLERQVALLSRKVLGVMPTAASHSLAKPVRFAAKGLRAPRNRLGLSQPDFGKLLGVSAQSIYNWERGQTRPRDQQIAKIATLRAVGKREAGQTLKQLVAARRKPQRKAIASPTGTETTMRFRSNIGRACPRQTALERQVLNLSTLLPVVP